MESLFRRRSGVYYARLVVPTRLRHLVGKVELIASTGTRNLMLAKIVGAGILQTWRARFLELDGLSMDIVQLKIGSPVLAGTGFLGLMQAAQACGLEPGFLLQQAEHRGKGLYFNPGAHPGFFVPFQELDRDGETGEYEIPSPMPVSAVATEGPGIVRLQKEEAKLVLPELLAGKKCKLCLFEVPGNSKMPYAPTGGASFELADILLAATDVEAIRCEFAAQVTPEHLGNPQAFQAQPVKAQKQTKRTDEAISAYMAERAKDCRADQARRIRAACELFAELMGNPRLCDVDRALLRKYRDEVLPTVPANENKVRLQHGTTSVKNSIESVEGTDWPRISQAECSKRMQWLCGLFAWLAQEKWIPEDPSVGLGTQGSAKKRPAHHLNRDLFTPAELQAIFSADWFQSGHGQLTKAGTYREFCPFYYWLPLLGLFTGARINELCQLSLTDFRQTDAGNWFIDINEDDGEKKLKNASSSRKIPLHRFLIDMGLLKWREELRLQGHTRLFPELTYGGESKGYSAAAVKWFSGYLERLGWERNGRKVFHSFRHTLASRCLNALGLSEAVTAQISGHKRGNSVLSSTYRKDQVPDEVAKAMASLDFSLPPIKPFDVEQGTLALKHALERKKPSSAVNTKETS